MDGRKTDEVTAAWDVSHIGGVLSEVDLRDSKAE
jgi:hypothetical protein